MVIERRTAVALILGAWMTLILVTHAGSRSPYTYAAQAAAWKGVPVTRSANPDAVTVVPVTRFFYDGIIPHYGFAHNLRLPLHSFATAIVIAFVRPYEAANYVVNWLFMVLLTIAAVRAGTMFRLRPAAMLLALGTIYALPAFVCYLGQPMQYIAGPVINYLIILAALTLPDDDLRNPLIAGLMTAVMTLSYDWYVFGAALAAYLYFVVRFRTLRDALLYPVAALAPIALWQRFVDTISNNEASYALRSKFFGSVVAGWAEYVHHFFQRPVEPFSVTHIGAHIGTHEVLAMIWWPLLLCCIVGLWIRRPSLRSAVKLLLLLVIFFALEQLFTAAFDPENNPRRALPIVFAFAIAWLWVVDQFHGRKWWTATFVVLFALSAYLAFADTLTKSPAMVPLYMGEAVREEPKWIMIFQEHRIEISEQHAPEQAAVRGTMPRASLRTMNGPFAISQLYTGVFMLAFFWILARARLLPRFAPHAFVALWVLSAVRYLW